MLILLKTHILTVFQENHCFNSRWVYLSLPISVSATFNSSLMSLPLALDQPHRIWKSGASEQLSMSSRNSHKTILNCLVRTTPTLGPHECSPFRIGKMVIPTAHECSSRSAQFSCRKSPPKKRWPACENLLGDTKKLAINAIQHLLSAMGHIFVTLFQGNFRNSSPQCCWFI